MKGFTAQGNSVTYGLLGIKNVGSDFISRIIEERQNGPYTELYDFCNRLQGREFNKRAVESLIRCGAMDCFGTNRRAMLQALPSIVSQLESDRRKNVEGQMGFFELTASDSAQAYVYPEVPEFSKSELLQMEKEMTGLYLSGHPVDKYQNMIASGQCAPVSELLEADSDPSSRYKDNMIVNVIGVINHVTSKTVRNGGVMAFMPIEDIGGSIEVILFPKTLSAFQNIVKEGNIVMVTGKLSIEEEKEPKILAERVLSADSIPQAAKQAPKKKRRGLFLRFESASDPRIEQVKQVLSKTGRGSTPLYFYYLDNKAYDLQPEEASPIVTKEILEKIHVIIGEPNTAFVE